MFQIRSLGSCRFDSPLKKSLGAKGHKFIGFVTDDDRILYNPRLDAFRTAITHGMEDPISIELAGPREKIFFDSSKTKAAIVTCGGLCPGINNVIRALTLELYYRYGVEEILGIRYGYSGFTQKNFEPVKLNPKVVEDIHMIAGTILGSSRGSNETKEIVDYIENNKINMLFCIGGDGTLRGARDIALFTMLKGYPLAVVGLPKTIDNDISYISRSFGFGSAVQEAMSSIKSAHTEAKGYYNGIGLVKLMGRYSGFIASETALAVNDANFVLIPEVDFDLDGKNGFLTHLFRRLESRHHAVIIVAEGTGQNFFDKDKIGYDASGNKELGDIGKLLKNEILNYGKTNKIQVQVKYIDPSYMIRSTVANSDDAIYCIQLAQNAVHAAMAGKTNLLIGHLHENFTNLPIDTAVSKRKNIDPTSPLWMNVLEATGQPVRMKNS
ncbi:MAG: ATP-dependent 6-phosphofructokinase [Proteobacteria bacterium]|nr:ATP-dependent 6-phosphofructokinase [Pseudomonadota bacterium]